MADAAPAAVPEGPAAAAAVGAGGDVGGAADTAVGNQAPLRPDLPPAIPVSQPLKDLQQAQGESWVDVVTANPRDGEALGAFFFLALHTTPLVYI